MDAATPPLPIINTLQKAVGLLNQTHAELKANILRQCQFITHPNLRITIFGPFNHGKSTLLNALLGSKTLPIALVPTTGAAITITYGPELTSRITFTNGSIKESSGTDLLHRYATLNEQRQLQPSVATVEVQCPHPLLQPGVELVDLPGTDDQTTHNQLVHTNLLEADVVIQLLDGRKLMTLEERTHLQDWLMARGVTTVLFVVNFLNLVEPEERLQLVQRLQTLAANFCTSLPPGLSNLYAVDALPALRTRLKGDTFAVNQTGLPELESALQCLIQDRLPQLATHRLPRLVPLVKQLQQAFQQQLENVNTSPPSQQDILQQKAQQLLQTGFQQSVTDLEHWLTLDNLLERYQQRFATELQANRLPQWLDDTLKPMWNQKKEAAEEWVHKACELFNQACPAGLQLSWPSTPNASDQASYGTAYQYLSDFSETTLLALKNYTQQAEKALTAPSNLAHQKREGEKQLLRNTLADLEHLQDGLKRE